MRQKHERFKAALFLCLFALWITCAAGACLQQESFPSSAPIPSPSPTPAPSAKPTPDDHYLREGLKGIAEDSKTLTTWGLTLIGASIAAIVSTGYLRPVRTKFRMFYLLFIPGWLFIAFSIHNGDKISRRYTATVFTQKHDVLMQIGNYINSEFDRQLTFLRVGLMIFSAWLLFFILWWVFGKTDANIKTKRG